LAYSPKRNRRLFKKIFNKKIIFSVFSLLYGYNQIMMFLNSIKHIQETIIGGWQPAAVGHAIGIEPKGHHDIQVQQ